LLRSGFLTLALKGAARCLLPENSPQFLLGSSALITAYTIALAELNYLFLVLQQGAIFSDLIILRATTRRYF